jgi:hypothetical protein
MGRGKRNGRSSNSRLLRLDEKVFTDLKLTAELARSLGGKELQDEFLDIVRIKVSIPLVHAAQRDAVAQGSHARRVAPTIVALRQNIRIGSLAIPYWAGAVFGGRSEQFRTFISRRGANRFVIRRRTTMQFRQWRDQQPYVLWPVWESMNAKLTADLASGTRDFVAARLQNGS